MKQKKVDPIFIYDREMEYLQGNPYVFFLLRQIDQELKAAEFAQSLSEYGINKDGAFDLYEVMWLATDKDIKPFYCFIPNNNNYITYIMDILTESKGIELNDIMVSDNLEQSWIIKRISTLKIDFSENMKEICKDSKIPFRSIIKMYHIFAYCMVYNELDDEILNQYPECPDDFWEIQVPKGLKTDEKENTVRCVWESIRKLFIESLHVFIATAALEMLYLTGLYKRDGLESIKTRLQSLAIEPELSVLMENIDSQDKLQEFFLKYFYCFYECLLNIGQSFNEYLNMTASKKTKMLMFQTDPYSNIFKYSEIRGNDDHPEFKYQSRRGFSNSLIKSNGLFQKYKLKGDPHNLVKYIQRTFNNISRNYYRDHLDKVIKMKFDISPRQLSRYNKNLKEGKYDRLFDEKNPKPKSIYDLLNDFDFNGFNAIRNIENKNRKHVIDGYLTQNRLISTLSVYNEADFTLTEFKAPFSTENLINEMLIADYDLPEDFSEKYEDDGNHHVKLLNIFLESTDFIDNILKVNPNVQFSEELKKLILETTSYRNLDYENLSDDERHLIKWMNRMILETVHPGETPVGIRSNSFSREYGISFEKISGSTYKTILKQLIEQGKIEVKKIGQTILYPADVKTLSDIAKHISDHYKMKKRKNKIITN